jgi:XTP/dITP diphosphohydrolase
MTDNPMNKLLIATNNKGKILEFQELLAGSGIEFVTPAQINLQLEVDEDGATYRENAAKKALAFAGASGLISLADDSGLEVDALDGAPGLYSARYSPKSGAKDADRRAFLLANLKDKPRPWTAHFHATIAIARPPLLLTPPLLTPPLLTPPLLTPPLLTPPLLTPPSPAAGMPPTLPPRTAEGAISPGVAEGAINIEFAEGNCHGEIIPEERGTGGFGYDPIFLLTDIEKTMAELDMEKKNRLSHRARAMMAAMPALKKIFSIEGV